MESLTAALNQVCQLESKITDLIRQNEKAKEEIKDLRETIRLLKGYGDCSVNAFSNLNKVIYGCHGNDPIEEPSLHCVWDTLDIDNCLLASSGIKKEDCKYWKPIKCD